MQRELDLLERPTSTSEPLVPDVLKPGLAVVFCGTALGHESYRQRAYYANRTNLFWTTLHRVGFTPHLIAPKDYLHVLDYGIGLTDVSKTAHGNDAELVPQDFDAEGTRHRIKAVAPAYLAFTSLNAASKCLMRKMTRADYGLLPETLGKTKLYALPSPSFHARRWWDESYWQRLADLTKPLQHIKA
jgi:TDG/mug DNA glycosylase family protein